MPQLQQAQQAQIMMSDQPELGWGNARRPIEGPGVQVNKRTGTIQYRSNNGIWVNSVLRKDEWEALDEAVVETAGPRTDVFERIPKVEHTSIGVMEHQYNTISQHDAAQVSMTGETPGQTDLTDYNLKGVPLPVIYKQINYGERTLQASRLKGSGLDVTQVTQATRVVSEELANMLYNGKATVNFNGSTVLGLTTETNRNTGSASGDFGTISNIYPTVLAMLKALDADNYHGPFEVDIASTQYLECLNRYSDGSGQTALDAILQIPGIQAVNSNDQLAAGSLILREIGRDILEWAQIRMGGQTVNGLEISLVEWMSGDGFTHHFKVMAIGAPVVKSDYGTQSGIAHFTGA